MIRCYKDCEHFDIYGYCRKYHKIIRSYNGLYEHPLSFFRIYFQEDTDGPVRITNDDIADIVKVAENYLTDELSKSIVSYYKKHSKLSFRQRKHLVWKLLNDCYEPKKPKEVTLEEGFIQIED